MPFILTHGSFLKAVAQGKGWKRSKLSLELLMGLSLNLLLPSDICQANVYGADASVSANTDVKASVEPNLVVTDANASYDNFFDSSLIPAFGSISNKASHAFNPDFIKRGASLYGYTKFAGTSTGASNIVNGTKVSVSKTKGQALISNTTANAANAMGVTTSGDGDFAVSSNANDIEDNKVPLLDEGADQAFASCLSSFNETRQRVLQANTQSVILYSNSNGIAPFIMLQIAAENGSHYVLWQSLNGDIRGYALRDGKGFDYANNANTPLPLSWHPTFIWDKLFGAEQKLKNYSCVLTGRTRVMGKRVSLLRFIPQEGLRYSLLLAKEDESDFPVELSLLDPKGGLVARLTTMDSRIIVGVDFPLADTVFDRIEHSQKEGRLGYENLLLNHEADAMSPASDTASLGMVSANGAAALNAVGKNERRDLSAQLHLPSPTVNAGATVPALPLSAANDNAAMSMGMGKVSGEDNVWPQLKSTVSKSLKPWPELNIPEVYTIIASGPFALGGNQCFYQEYSDGITSFRVYRNKRSTNFYPALSNGSISCVRKNTLYHEYVVVGEVPVALAEFVLTKIVD